MSLTVVYVKGKMLYKQTKKKNQHNNNLLTAVDTLITNNAFLF